MWQKATDVDLEKLTRIPSNQYKYVQGMNIAYKDIPGEKVLFCLPPWPSSSTVYIPLALALGDSVRIIAIDMPGWGGYSDKPRFKPTLKNYASLAADFIASFDLPEYSILGYSFGGAILQTALGAGSVSPQKNVFVSSLHNGEAIAYEHGKLLKLYKWAKSIGMPDSFIKKMTETYMLKFHRYHKSKFYEHFEDNLLYKQILKEDLRSDISSIFGVLFSLIESEALTAKSVNRESIVIYADSDPSFIKKESRQLAEFLGVEPIYLENVDHDHLPFDVNKSADIILNFLLA